MQDLFGRKHYDGMASVFEDYAFSKECMLRAGKKIRRRLNEITMDERLREITNIILNRLERNSKEMSEEINNDWYLIAHLLDLIVHLLGYDWLDGRVHRHVFFYQDRAQEQIDWKYKKGREYFDEWRQEDKRRYMLVNFLKKKQIPKFQIAALLGISVKRVGKILQGIAEYEKETGKNFPKFEER